MSCEVKGLVVVQLSWIDPTSFVAMNSNTLLYFTKHSEKPLDFYFLIGTHLNSRSPSHGAVRELGRFPHCWLFDMGSRYSERRIPLTKGR